MPRTKEFDPEIALDKALKLFWHKGYAETSMRDVVAYTGVAHAGLYNVFGSKRDLFLMALKHHLKVNLPRLSAKINAPDSGRAELEQFFLFVLKIVQSGNFDDGCFMANSAVAFGTEPSDILDIFNEHVDRMENNFRTALENAKAKGEVRADLDPLSMADLLVTLFNGIAVLTRGGSGYDRIERSIRTALAMLD